MANWVDTIVYDNHRGTFNVPNLHRGAVRFAASRNSNPQLDRQYGLCYNGFYTVNIWQLVGDNLHRAADPKPFSTAKDAREYLENDTEYSGLNARYIAAINHPNGDLVGQYLNSCNPSMAWYQ